MRSRLPVGLAGFSEPTTHTVPAEQCLGGKPRAETLLAGLSEPATHTMPAEHRQRGRQHGEALLLGVHATAAWRPNVGLPGVVGPLRPAWHQVRGLDVHVGLGGHWAVYQLSADVRLGVWQWHVFVTHFRRSHT